MKATVHIFTIFVFLFIFHLREAEGQIWKKIKKKTQDKVERTISDKASDKAAELAAKNMDRLLNADINPFGKGEKKEDTSDLPEQYSFEWKYQLQLQTNVKGEEKKMAIDYYISPGNPYVGFTMPQMPSMFTVMDSKQQVMVAYMEQGQNPIAMAYNLPESANNTGEAAEGASDFEDYTVTKLPNKEFLGYTCQGLQLENTDYRVVMYFTTEAGVSFSEAVKSDQAKVPAQLKKYMHEKSNGLVTYMNMINKKDPARNITMEGISLDKTVLIKRNANYKFM